MNAIGMFELANYAHNGLEPYMAAVGGHLEIVLDFEPSYGAIQLWVFPTHPVSGSIAHRTGVKTKTQVDAFIAEVQAKASVPA